MVRSCARQNHFFHRVTCLCLTVRQSWLHMSTWTARSVFLRVIQIMHKARHYSTFPYQNDSTKWLLQRFNMVYQGNEYWIIYVKVATPSWQAGLSQLAESISPSECSVLDWRVGEWNGPPKSSTVLQVSGRGCERRACFTNWPLSTDCANPISERYAQEIGQKWSLLRQHSWHKRLWFSINHHPRNRWIWRRCTYCMVHFQSWGLFKYGCVLFRNKKEVRNCPECAFLWMIWPTSFTTPA